MDGWTLIVLAKALHRSRCRRPHDLDGRPGKDGKGCGFFGDEKAAMPDHTVGAAHRELWVRHAEEVLNACGGEVRGVLEGLALAHSTGPYADKTFTYTPEEVKAYEDRHFGDALRHISRTLRDKRPLKKVKVKTAGQ